MNTVAEHSTCLVTEPQRWKGSILCCQNLYTHNCNHVETHTCSQYTHTSIHTQWTNMAGLIHLLATFVSEKRLHIISLPWISFHGREREREREREKRALFGISYSSYLSPYSLPFFFHHWLCPNLDTSEGWLSCIWITQCLTTGLQILIVAVELKLYKEQTPRKHHHCQFFSKQTQSYTMFPTPERWSELMWMLCVFVYEPLIPAL